MQLHRLRILQSSGRILRSFRTAQAVASCNARFGIDALGERADHVQLIFAKRRVSEVSTRDALELREFMDSSCLNFRNTLALVASPVSGGVSKVKMQIEKQ